MKNWLLEKDPDSGKDWRQEEKGTIENEMVRWHHRLNGHEFEQALGAGDGQGSLACSSPWGRKELDMTEQLNWTCAKISLDHFSIPWTKIDSNVLIPECKTWNHKTCRRKHRQSAIWHQCWQYFFRYVSSGKCNKRKNKRDYTFKIFCTAKKTSKELKRQKTKWEKMFANPTSTKG